MFLGTFKKLLKLIRSNMMVKAGIFIVLIIIVQPYIKSQITNPVAYFIVSAAIFAVALYFIVPDGKYFANNTNSSGNNSGDKKGKENNSNASEDKNKELITTMDKTLSAILILCLSILFVVAVLFLITGTVIIKIVSALAALGLMIDIAKHVLILKSHATKNLSGIKAKMDILSHLFGIAAIIVFFAFDCKQIYNLQDNTVFTIFIGIITMLLTFNFIQSITKLINQI